MLKISKNCNTHKEEQNMGSSVKLGARDLAQRCKHTFGKCKKKDKTDHSMIYACMGMSVKCTNLYN